MAPAGQPLLSPLADVITSKSGLPPKLKPPPVIASSSRQPALVTPLEPGGMSLPPASLCVTSNVPQPPEGMVPEAISVEVTVPSLISSDVTSPSFIFPVVTASLAKLILKTLLKE
jgi:hypothetical protein